MKNTKNFNYETREITRKRDESNKNTHKFVFFRNKSHLTSLLLSRPFACFVVCFLFMAIVIMVTAFPVFAQDTTPKSGEDMRDPFWPVGYAPKKKVVVQQNKKTDTPQAVDVSHIPWPKLKLKGITKGASGYMAIIQGVGIVEPGKIIKIEKNGLIFRWRIDKITRKRISHTKLDARPAR